MRTLIQLLAVALGLTFFPALCTAQAPAEAPDLTVPAWDLCAGPDRSQMACFTQDEVRQLLRLQEHARYRFELTQLHSRLQDRMQALVVELEASQREYVALRQVIEERNVTLREELAEARAEVERYRGRVERRRIWPWVALGFGLLTGSLVGAQLAK